jgi:Domain of unknown function (DUF4412)
MTKLFSAVLSCILVLPLVSVAQTPKLPFNPRSAEPRISPADSIAAMRNFSSASGGSGYEYKYHITYHWKIRGKDSVSQDDQRTCFTNSRNSSTEISMLGARSRIIGNGNMPHYSLWVYPDTKNYSLKYLDTAGAASRDRATYQVTKVGTETVGGYTCTHAQLKTSYGRGTSTTQDIWTSKDIPGYSVIQQMFSGSNVTPKMMQALDQAGCGGFFVKMTMESPQISMTMVLTSASATNLPASLFQLPSGYTPAAAGGFFGGMR